MRASNIPNKERRGGRSLALLLASFVTLGAMRGLITLDGLDFWWQCPRLHAWFLVSLYWSAVVATLLTGGAGTVLLFSSASRWRIAGITGVVGGVWVLLGLIGSDVREVLGDYWNIAAGNARPAAVVYERARQRIRISGAIDSDSAARFKEVLETAADARIVDVSGPGGLIYEARWIFHQIEQRGLDTIVTTKCASACVDIFASGRRRLMHATAVVGLHSARSTEGDVAGVEEENRAFTERLYKIGVEPRFLMVGTETPADGIWINTARQAYLAGLATEVVEQFD